MSAKPPTFGQGADRSTTAHFLATGATGVTLIAARNATSVLHIQQIVLSLETYATGSLLFTATDATGSGIGVIPVTATDGSSQADDLIRLDYGEKGLTMSDGASLFMTRTTTGSVGYLTIKAYETPKTTPVAMGSTN